MSEFYDLFDGYDREKIDLAVERLRKNDREFICQYYGVRGFNRLKIEELVEKYGITASGVRHKRQSCVDKIANILVNPNGIYSNNEMFYKMYSKYNTQDVFRTLGYLTARCKKVLELYYGLNGNDEMDMKDIAIECGVDINTVNSTLIYGNERLVNILNDMNIFQDSLAEFAESLHIVDNYLNIRDKKIVDIYYECSSVNDLFYRVTKSFNVNYSEARKMINECIRNIKKTVDKINKFNRNNVLFYELFGNYSLEEINSTLDTFGEKRKEIISRYYGINGYNCTEMKDIAKILDVSVSWVSFSIRRDSEKLKFLLKHPNEISMKRRFFKDFSGYEKDLVEKVLVKFSLMHQEILKESYGFNGYKVLSREKICSKYNIDDDSLDRILDFSVKRIKDIIDEGKFNDKSLKYDLDNFKSYLDVLSREEKEIIVRYYGLLGYKEQEIDEIARNLDIDPLSIGLIVEDIEKDMDDNLTNLEFLNKKKKNMDAFLSELMTKDKVKVKKAMSFLNKKEEKVLAMYYGLDSFVKSSNDEIAFFLKIDEKDVEEEVEGIIEKINDNLYNLYYNKGKKNK